MTAFTVLNLKTNTEEIYLDETTSAQAMVERRINCLINSAMMLASETSSLHNPTRRDHYRGQVKLGQRTASIGDLCVQIR